MQSVTSGYAGGQTANPTYEGVSGGATGHAEVIKVVYNPAEIRFEDLLTVFFATHDPTTPNRQGSDVGPQYRSMILYTNETQKQEAETFIKKLNDDDSGRPVVTELKPLEAFYDAEAYHHEYYRKNATAPYCQIVINPKLEKLKERFTEVLKTHS